MEKEKNKMNLDLKMMTFSEMLLSESTRKVINGTVYFISLSELCGILYIDIQIYVEVIRQRQIPDQRSRHLLGLNPQE